MARLPRGPDAAALALRAVGDHGRRALDPIEAFAEATFGLIMVLTVTGAVRVAEGGRQELRGMLVAALGCNVAWGLVDAAMFLLTSVAARARGALVHRGLLAADAASARELVLGVVPEAVAAAMTADDVDRIVARVRTLPAPPAGARLTLSDVRGAALAFLLVLAATLPPALPYLLLTDLARAERASEAVAVASLFLAGWALGKKTGVRAGLLGAVMVLVGAGLVGLTIALGG